jgi:hypothetical protein
MCGMKTPLMWAGVIFNAAIAAERGDGSVKNYTGKAWVKIIREDDDGHL